MAERPGPVRAEPESVFRALVRMLGGDGGLSGRAAVVLDLCGRAMGLDEELRTRLARDPGHEPPLAAEELGETLDGLLAQAPREVAADSVELVLGLLGLERPQAHAPLCPSCRSGGGVATRRIWAPPPGTGMGPLERTRTAAWSCPACLTLLDCTDQAGAPEGAHRQRQLRVRTKGPEIEEVMRNLRAAKGNEDAVVAALAAAPVPAWLLERSVGAPEEVWRALGTRRNLPIEDPARAPACYAEPNGLVRYGPPATPAVWRALVGAELPVGLLARLAALPGAPEDVRAALLVHPDPEVRYQTILAPDLPTPMLAAILDRRDPSEVLSLLDRPDSGRRALERSIETASPHVLYRLGRHPSLDLLLLERARAVRRASLPSPLPPTRALHVYASSREREPVALRERVLDRARLELGAMGLREQPGLPGAGLGPALGPRGELQLVCLRVSLSRVILFLPWTASPGQLESLVLERFVEGLKRGLLASLADEVVELRVDEAGGTWDAEVRRNGNPCHRTGATGLPPVREAGEEIGRWLEFELFAAERALAHPGVPCELPMVRLVTRPPYVMRPPEPEPPTVLCYGPT